ncbi:MAG: SDR family NAD(P)-dependent oxidoreductase [Flavobacteriaceae bacterium]
MKKVCITGASSGIGEAIAEIFASRGYELILCGRNRLKLQELKSRLDKLTKCIIVVFDVRDRERVSDVLTEAIGAMQGVDVLINNAGNAHGLGTVQEGNPDDWDAMIDINVKGLLNVTHAVLPYLVKQNSGHIINIGSLAGKEVYRNGTVYCASKHAVDAISEGLRKDLLETDIKIGCVHPGLVATNFSMVRFKGDKNKSNAVYKGYEPLQAKDIAEIVDFVVSRPAHVNIADLLVLPSAQASSTEIKKNL